MQLWNISFYLDELRPEDIAHLVDGAGVGPVAVVHGREGDLRLETGLRGVEHVGGVERVDVVRRECRLLFRFLDG